VNFDPEISPKVIFDTLFDSRTYSANVSGGTSWERRNECLIEIENLAMKKGSLIKKAS
jgi:hypothetical protein